MELNLSPEVPHALRAFCATVGSNPRLVQGAGGNLSWKDPQGRLIITASGTALSSAERDDIFVSLDLGPRRLDFSQSVPPELHEVLGKAERRPSIEWSLHAYIPSRYVLHLHPVDVLALMVRKDWNSRLALEGLVGYKETFVPYAKPGWDLTQLIHAQALAKNAGPVLFLQNHGVVIGADSLYELKQTLQCTMEAVVTQVRRPGAKPNVSVAPPPGWVRAPDPLNTLAQDLEIWSALEKTWALYPDHVVFLGAKPQMCRPEELAHLTPKEDKGKAPLFVKGVGIFLPTDFSSTQREMLFCFYEVLMRQENLKLVNSLTPLQVEELVHWDAERHRVNLSR